MSAQLLAAFKRLLFMIVMAALPLTIDFLTTQDFSEYGAYGAFVAMALARVLEGVYDTHRDSVGNVQPGDVTRRTNNGVTEHDIYIG